MLCISVFIQAFFIFKNNFPVFPEYSEKIHIVTMTSTHDCLINKTQNHKINILESVILSSMVNS